MRLIDADELKKDIDFQYICKCCHNVNGNVCDICHISEIEKKIDNAPTVEDYNYCPRRKRMTNKKAIRVLENIEHYLITHTNESCEEEHTAISLAIKALEERPQGEWIEEGKEE